MALPLSARKLDLLYLVFFVIHIPIVFVVDAVPLYPEWAKAQFMRDLRQFYIENYKDQFFVAPPAWFTLYTIMELVYHVPLSFWAIGALWKDDHRVPVQLLIYGMQTALTTLTCIAEAMSWKILAQAEKIQLLYLYVPYLALAVLMVTDMSVRLQNDLRQKTMQDRDVSSRAPKAKKEL